LCGVVYWGYATQIKPLMDSSTADRPAVELTQAPVDFSQRVPVPTNCGPEVLDGFRGEVHPLLQPQQLDVTARWESTEEGRAFATVPRHVSSLFKDLRVAIPTRTYDERDFSAFLPQEINMVGQLWALDLDRVADFLRQFHPRPSMHLVSKGKRAGPDGAF